MDRQKVFSLALFVFSVFLIITLTFIKIDFDAQSVYLCEATENNPDLQMINCPAHTSNTPNLLILGFIFSALVLVSSVYTFFAAKFQPTLVKENTKPKKDIASLPEQEQRVYTFLQEQDGSAYQSDLVKQLELSKVKVTRLLDSLERKNLIERRRRGMTNIVILK